MPIPSTGEADFSGGCALGPARWVAICRVESNDPRTTFPPPDQLTKAHLRHMAESYDPAVYQAAVVQAAPGMISHTDEVLSAPPNGEILELDFDGWFLWGLLAGIIDPVTGQDRIDAAVASGYGKMSIMFRLPPRTFEAELLNLEQLSNSQVPGVAGLPNLDDYGFGLRSRGALRLAAPTTTSTARNRPVARPGYRAQSRNAPYRVGRAIGAEGASKMAAPVELLKMLGDNWDDPNIRAGLLAALSNSAGTTAPEGGEPPEEARAEETTVPTVPTEDPALAELRTQVETLARTIATLAQARTQPAAAAAPAAPPASVPAAPAAPPARTQPAAPAAPAPAPAAPAPTGTRTDEVTLSQLVALSKAAGRSSSADITYIAAEYERGGQAFARSYAGTLRTLVAAGAAPVKNGGAPSLIRASQLLGEGARR